MRKLPFYIAAALGLVLALLTASTTVAWRFGFPPEMGRPVFYWLYDPLAVWRWGWHWGLSEAYRRTFLAALSISSLVLMLPVFLVRAFELYSPLAVGARDKNSGLGEAETLVRKGGLAKAGDGVVVGRMGRWSRKVLRDNGDGHVLLTGPSRAGKGTGHIIPTLLGHSGSMLVLDPKHELFAITGRRRAEFGTVHVFNPIDPDGACFNPLLELPRGVDLIGSAKAFAKMLCHDGSPVTDRHWDEVAAMIMAAAIVYVVESDDPTLRHVLAVAQRIQQDDIPTDTQNPYVIATWSGHTNREDRERSGINSNLVKRLECLEDPRVQMATSRSDFRSSDLQAGSRPLTLFVSIPPNRAEAMRPLTRLILHAMLSPLLHDVNVCADGRTKRRGALALLDEFPQLGKLDVIEHGINISAGYGIRMFLVCQDAAQIENIYGVKQSITNNCQTVLAISGYSGSSLAMMSAWAGDHAVRHQSKQLPGLMRGRVTESETEARIKVLNASDMLTRGKNEVLVFVRGCLPTWLYRADYYKLRAFRGLYDRHEVGGPTRIANREADPRAIWVATGGRT
jgi:type IV secretion system protein VirD4